MSQTDIIKETISYLKFWLGIMVVLDISLVGWLLAHAGNSSNLKALGAVIGIGAIILDNAVLEDYVLLGAGALVPPGKVLESGYLYIGSPAKKARPLSDTEKEYLEYSSAHYVQLKDEYLEI